MRRLARYLILRWRLYWIRIWIRFDYEAGLGLAFAKGWIDRAEPGMIYMRDVLPPSPSRTTG
jgi:hypothetical protein